jgi:peroxin-5
MPTSAPQYPQDQYSSAYQPRMNNYSSFTPMYSGYNAQMSQPQAQLGPQQRSVEEQKAMEDAFEKALEDARAQTTSEKVQEDVEQKEEAKEEQVDESDGTYTAEGEFEKVWQSLRPEAERLGKLAEWEKDFSQVNNDFVVRCRDMLTRGTVCERRGRPV